MRLNFNLSAGFYLFGSLVLFFLFYRFRFLEKKKHNRFASLFKKMAMFSGLGTLIYCLFFILFSHNSLYLFIGNTLGEPFVLVGFVYGFAISVLIFKPQIPSNRVVVPLAVLAVILSIVSHIMFPFAPLIDKDGVLHWNAHPVPGLIYTIFSLLGLLPLVIAFSWQGAKNKNVRPKTFLFALGILLMFFSGVILSLASGKNFYVLALIMQNFGFIFLLYGSLVKGAQKD